MNDAADHDSAEFVRLVATIEPPRCQLDACRRGHPAATHAVLVILPCHRSDALMCAACERRETKRIERHAKRHVDQTGVTCKYCGNRYEWITFGAAVQVVAL